MKDKRFAFALRESKLSSRVAFILGFIALALFLSASLSFAQSDEACLACHKDPSLKVALPSGEDLLLYVNPDDMAKSVHGRTLKCTACHANITGYPHPPLVAKDIRDFSLEAYTVCQGCHAEQYKKTLDSIHALVLAGGNRNAPVCTDCHSPHSVTRPDEPRSKISITCSKCHFAIFSQYKDSVHGAALLEESNPDVPTCVNCHGVHNIEDPRTVAFRLKSPSICAKCHADKALMGKYNVSTDVFDTYVADFHGTTVTLFEKTTPDRPTNKAVCYDCHGIHNIKKAADPEAAVVKENLLATCRQCHPNATANFPAAWTSHYKASPKKYPLVYYVGWFYRILIPAVIGSIVAFIGLDATRRIMSRLDGR
jgi:predicted CXXCH cytochrome family protein